jgi:5'-nucleotidase
MQILVSNDDGIDAPGLRSLVLALAEVADVWVAAPDRARSASGHSITLHKPLRADSVAVPGACHAWSVSGTPTDCVALGLRWLMKEKPDLVISGINYGPNLGWDLTYSGTVAAAMEGALLGVPSFAISLASMVRGVKFDIAAAFARRLAERMATHSIPAFSLLNVNVPWRNGREPTGVRITRQGKRRYDGAVVERSDPRGRPYYWLGGEIPEEELSPGTDTRAIIDGQISITPIHLDLTAVEILPELEGWDLTNPSNLVS